ncbi:MAG: hypothetical protein IT159_11440 [Bryobacterales bacterium]|nr:hypothetical protein [Bryobacterales bacterium]
MTRDEILRQLERAFRRYCGVPSSVTQSLVPPSVPAGKLYEAHVLSLIVEKLVTREGYRLALVGGTKVQLKSAPGPINRSYPRIELRRSGACVAELWTDVEFLSLSHAARRSGTLTKGDYHELDLIIVDPNQHGRPPHDTVWLGVECKNTGYEKGLLKEILGIRRELSYLTDDRPTKFSSWPRSLVPADPPSCLVVYATDADVLDYAAPGMVFGIDFMHESI